MSKANELFHIEQQIASCRTCKKVAAHLPKADRGVPVPGEGNPDADIVFVGEAPGRNEAITGRPFVGRSGKLLRSFITSIGLIEKDVFITSPVKIYPGMRTPTKDELLHGRKHLMDQLAVIQPKILVLLGNSSLFTLATYQIPVSKHHGTIMELGGYECFVTYHPSAAIRFKKNKLLMESDFHVLKSLVPTLTPVP